LYSERLDQEELADRRASRDAIYQFADPSSARRAVAEEPVRAKKQLRAMAFAIPFPLLGDVDVDRCSCEDDGYRGRKLPNKHSSSSSA
jgi:hypothetical protein